MLDCVAPDDFLYPEQFHRPADFHVWLPFTADTARPPRVDLLPPRGIVVTSNNCVEALVPQLGPGPYVVIVHRWMDDALLTCRTVEAAGNRVVRWLACQTTAWYQDEHHDPRRVEAMPNGFQPDAVYPGEPAALTAALQGPPPPRENRVFCACVIPPLRHATHRRQVRDFLRAQPFATWRENVYGTDYLRSILAHEFVMAPLGYGPDTMRVWETIYLQRIPIVPRNPFHNQLADLPIALYNDLSEITESWLDAQLQRCHALSARRASASYWINHAREILRAYGG